jgi:WD repeat-containing protein 76
LEEERAAREEQDRLDAQRLAEKAKEPRHQDLDLQEVLEAQDDEEENEKSRALLLAQLGELCTQPYPRAIGRDSDKEKGSTEKEKVKTELEGMRIVSRAKVTGDRIYSMAYHPEKVRS